MGQIIDLYARVPQQEFADLVGITQPHVSALVSQGVLEKSGTVGEWLLAYTAKLRDAASGRSNDLIVQRARYAKELADREEMANQERRKTILPVSVYERLLTETSRRIASILEAIPSQIRRRAGEIDLMVYQIIEDEIARARNMAAVLELPIEAIDGSLRAEAGASEGDEGDGSPGADELERVG